jgi:hypothetical protein
MPLQATSGAASYDAFGGGVPVVPKYIEDYFSTYLVTGDGTAPAVNNGIDLSTKGGLVWTKKRSAAGSHSLFDTARGANLRLISNDTAAQDSVNLSFTTTGFSNYTFDSGVTYTSWSWAKAPKFFDVVTYTGNGSARTIAHNLGSTPGWIIVKSTDGAGQNWCVYHRSVGAGNYLYLNTTAAQNADTGIWNNTAPTSSVFSVGGDGYNVNDSGFNYVAYLFAHDAGGFGLTGTDNVISCGSYVGNGSNTNGTNVDLGYEPQWLLIKKSSSGTSDWLMVDNMRGMTADGTDEQLKANSSGAADSTTAVIVKATGFQLKATGNPNTSGETYIYIAIRRGPMKVPTVGTSVYNNLANRVGTSATATISGVGFPVDLMLPFATNTGSVKPFVDRLRGATKYLLPPYSNAEQTETNVVTSFANNDGVIVGADSLDVINNYYNGDRRYAASFFRRSPSVFDIVCYTGTGNNPLVLNHNLGVPPELIIIKKRVAIGSVTNWYCGVNFTASTYTEILLNADGGGALYNYPNWFVSAPTATTFDLNGGGNVNSSGAATVAYLFATCAGVSKVGSYTGTGALQTINCGFTSGARFILIKRTDSTGDWYMYDSARGISASSDPYLLLNTTGASELGTNYVDTDSTGFKVTAAAPVALNANGGSFIFLAIA